MRISKFIADHLPANVMVWAIVRAFAYTTTHECSHKTPEETGYSDLFKSWNHLAKGHKYVKKTETPNT